MGGFLEFDQDISAFASIETTVSHNSPNFGVGILL